MDATRLPDVLVIGTRKSGTTTLHRWLDEQPEITMSRVKEPNFFSRDQEYARGLEWYSSLFAEVPGDALVGESSVEYSAAATSAVAARRIAKCLPQAKLVALLRDPVERTRSHYRHQVQRGREKRSFSEALSEANSPYVTDSLYAMCLQPFVDAAGDRLCVVRFEDVIGQTSLGWAAIVAHLGLVPRPHPTTVYNVTEEKRQFRGVTRRLFEHRLLDPLHRLPRPVRRVFASMGTRRGGPYQQRLDESREPVPAALVDALYSDAALLAARLSRPDLVWSQND